MQFTNLKLHFTNPKLLYTNYLQFNFFTILYKIVTKKITLYLKKKYICFFEIQSFTHKSFTIYDKYYEYLNSLRYLFQFDYKK